MYVVVILGNSRKYPYPTTDGFHVLTPLAFGNSRMRYPLPPCPQNSLIVRPRYPSGFPEFFWRYIFDSATFIWTNKHEFMPPQGCDLVAPGDKLYSSATRKTYRLRMARLCCLNLAIKNTSYGNFPPLCFLVLFWRSQSKIAQKTVKIFARNTVEPSIFPRWVPSYIM